MIVSVAYLIYSLYFCGEVILRDALTPTVVRVRSFLGVTSFLWLPGDYRICCAVGLSPAYSPGL